jgi:CRP-like cAMP-binding protein
MDRQAHATQVLQQLRPFAALPEAIQEELAVCALHRHFDAGEVIYVEGEPAEFTYILEAG